MPFIARVNFKLDVCRIAYGICTLICVREKRKVYANYLFQYLANLSFTLQLCYNLFVMRNSLA
jgi:hypothetical protein